MNTPWRDFLRAWGEVRTAALLERDDAGRYLIHADASQDTRASERRG
jgi:hypothetical protein